MFKLIQLLSYKQFYLNRKLWLVIFFAAFGSAVSQDLNLECVFFDTVYGEYTCALIDIEVLDRSQSVIIGGDHIGNRTNEDVEIVWIFLSNTPFMIQEIFSTFTNMIELEIDFSNLQSIEIPDTVQLEWLDLFGNDIRRIESDAFRNQSSLVFCFLSFNWIESIAEDAFESLTNLILLEFVLNDLEQFEPATFNPLTNILYLDFEANLLTSVGDLFSENTNLQSLYLEDNLIREIHPHFNANLRNNLRVIYLFDNNCINMGFSGLQDEVLWAIFNSVLRTCFHNFNGTTTEGKNLGVSFNGPLRIFDEFGNLIGSV